MIQIIFDYERGSRKNLLAFGVRVSLRKGTRSLEMETDNRVSVMENLEIEVEWCHCFETATSGIHRHILIILWTMPTVHSFNS